MGLKGQDCILLFVCLAGIWISLPSSTNLSIVQKWRISYDTSTFRNSHYPEEWEKLPLPVVADINNDGQQDIIFVNTEFEIKIASADNVAQLGEEIADDPMVNFSNMKLFSQGRNSHLKLKVPELSTTHSASLLPQFAITYGRRPVALAVGYIDPPSQVQRHQVIVVLTEGWVVMCFDHELNLLWESHAVQNPNPGLYHKEASVLIDPTPLAHGDRGVIVVGGRKEFLDSGNRASHEHLNQKDFALPPETLDKMKEEALNEKNTRPRVRKLQQIDEEEEADLEIDDFDLGDADGDDLEDANELGDEAEPLAQEAEEVEEEEDQAYQDELDDEEEEEDQADEEEEQEVEEDEEPVDAQVEEEEEEVKQWDIEEEEIEDETREEDNHFSYYAFDGHTGSLRWKHEPLDYSDLNDPDYDPERVLNKFMQSTSHAETPDVDLKLHLFHNLRHLGEKDWIFFADHIKAQLPYVWRTREDTSMVSDYFRRERSFGKVQGDDDDGGYAIGKRNVLVSRSTTGVEVLHLYSGHPLTRFEMNPESLYLDLNYDGVIDRVDAVPEKPQRGGRKRHGSVKDKCLAIAYSGVPTIEGLFETNVCSSGRFQFGFGLDSVTGRRNEDVDMANPTFLETKTGRYNTVFLVSSGRVTALSPEGEVIWQVDSDATWSRAQTQKTPSRASRFGRVDSFLDMGGFPSIQPINIYEQHDYVVAVGYHTLSVISRAGRIEAETKLPSVVNGPTISGDWDSDGDTDIIVPAIDGLIGLRVTKGSSTPLYSIMFGIILATLPILYLANQVANKNSKRRPTTESNAGNFDAIHM